MKRLATCLVMASLAGLSLGLPAHQAARAPAGPHAAGARALATPAAHTSPAAAPQPYARPKARGDSRADRGCGDRRADGRSRRRDLPP
jgi:hypothetical protein